MILIHHLSFISYLQLFLNKNLYSLLHTHIHTRHSQGTACYFGFIIMPKDKGTIVN